MYSLKEAMVTKERFAEDIETTIFYMDMRTFGKDYERYLERAENQYDVRMLRSRPHSIFEDEKTKNLSITYTVEDQPSHITETFDMVVLSTGFRIPDTTLDLMNRLDISVNDYRFAESDPFNPVVTSRPGVYVCGVAESPKDIPETMVQASAAATMASHYITETDRDPDTENNTIPERDI